ncbi:hypothetical protein C8R42DRAFT_726348 [Lentinula raphanica]|nr:hypothetical protein C8R42DRAFT_726348 [Lentinula raphanica]
MPGNSTRHDRVELLAAPSTPKSVDRRILYSSGPSRTPRVVHRTSPYNNRSPSPDPRFQSSSPATPTPTSLQPPRIISARPTSLKLPRATTVMPTSLKLPRATSITPTSPKLPRAPTVSFSSQNRSAFETYTIYDQSLTPIRSSRPRVVLSTTQKMASPVDYGKQTVPENHEEDHIRVQTHDDDVDDEADDDGSDRKIAKPSGEVGRPGRGGYNLRHALNWSIARFDKVKRFIDATVETKLDCLKPLSKQDRSKVEEVRTLAVTKFSFLEDYRDDWVVYDFIRCHLKYRKQALQKLALEETATQAQEKIQEYQQRLRSAEKRARRSESHT